MLHTTFTRLHKSGACTESYKKLATAMGGITKYGKDMPIPLDKILDVCGLDDALWCLRAIIEDANKAIRLFACDCAEQVLPIFEKKCPDDNRPRQAIEVSRKFANREVATEELRAAWAAARAARDAAWAADAAGDAAWAARDAAGAACAAEDWQEKRFRELLAKEEG